MPLVAAAAIMAAGSVAGGIIGKQKAPQAAQFKTVDPQAEQRKAIEGNLANSDSIEQLIAKGNSFNQDQANSLMERAMPGYSKIASKFMTQANGLLTDPYSLPTDVTANLTRLASERGINTGVRGQAGDFSLLRDFGINSLQYGQSRINQAQGIMQTLGSLAPRVNPMSPMSFYVTPAQAIQSQQANNAGQYNSQQSADNASAAATNANAAMWGNIVTNVSSTIGGMVAGGAGGMGSKIPAVGRAAGNTDLPALAPAGQMYT